MKTLLDAHYQGNSVISRCGFHASNQRACITALNKKRRREHPSDKHSSVCRVTKMTKTIRNSRSWKELGER